MRIAIVGAGIMGASVAYHLSLPGRQIALFEQNSGPAQGVTQHAFGWINAINADPTETEVCELRTRGIYEYERLLREMPEVEAHVRRGSLVWRNSRAATEALARGFGDSAGFEFELLDGKAVSKMEPQLKRAPGLAIFSPRDIAVDPTALGKAFLRRTTADLHYGAFVGRIEMSGSRVTGLWVDGQLLHFDLIVLAAGVGTNRLLGRIGVQSSLAASPVVLLRYRSCTRFVEHILSWPELEIRQAANGDVLVVEEHYQSCEQDDFRAMRQRVETTIGKSFNAPRDLGFQHGAIGERPMFLDGRPRAGFVEGIAGLYQVVAHPGVILAPVLGRLTAQDIQRIET